MYLAKSSTFLVSECNGVCVGLGDEAFHVHGRLLLPSALFDLCGRVIFYMSVLGEFQINLIAAYVFVQV